MNICYLRTTISTISVFNYHFLRHFNSDLKSYLDGAVLRNNHCVCHLFLVIFFNIHCPYFVMLKDLNCLFIFNLSCFKRNNVCSSFHILPCITYFDLFYIWMLFPYIIIDLYLLLCNLNDSALFYFCRQYFFLMILIS